MSEKFTYHHHEEQLASGNENPTVLIPRSDGRIVVGKHEVINGEHYATFTEDGEEKAREAKPEAFSDQAQDYYANQLASSVERTPEELERYGKAEKDLADTALEAANEPFVSEEEAAQAAHEETRAAEEQEKNEREEKVLNEVGDLIRTFKRNNEELVSESVERTRSHLTMVDEFAAAVNRLKYESLSKEAFIRDSHDLMSTLRSRLSQDIEAGEGIVRDTRRLESAVEEAASGLREPSDETHQKIRQAESALEELQGQTRALGYIDEEVSGAAQKIVSLLDSFSYDNWGGETYVAQFQQAAAALEDTLAQRRSRLMYVQEQLSYMK